MLGYYKRIPLEVNVVNLRENSKEVGRDTVNQHAHYVIPTAVECQRNGVEGPESWVLCCLIDDDTFRSLDFGSRSARLRSG